MSPKNAARTINSWLKPFAPALSPHSPGRTRAAQASSQKLLKVFPVSGSPKGISGVLQKLNSAWLGNQAIVLWYLK
jgi:hypothetical protein